MPDEPTSTGQMRETEQFLHEQIPLSKAMGVRVESLAEGALTLTAPLEPNHNHLGTAFGGSLAALTTLAGYALLWWRLGDRRCHIVIRESSLRYRHPVTGVLRAVCRAPEALEFEQFRATLAQSGKARMRLKVTLEEAGRVCVEFEGEFVALAG